MSACAGGIPQAELDRCRLGVADGNDAFQVRQGAACRMVAQRLATDERPGDAMGYARKACELEDGKGCEQYLALARGQRSLPPDELSHARAAGERACAGMVVGVEGADARPAICARTAELYQDVEPRSPDDAGRLYARACKLGDSRSCAHANGSDDTSIAPKASTKTALPPPPVSAPLLPRTMATTTAGGAPAAPCHEMRPCVALDVNQRNTSEVVGTIVNRCDRQVACTWCPSRGDQVDKSGCRSATLAPNESRTGREQGLWYEGFNAIAYDCMDSSDDKGCLAM
jgi:hypothetical protein